MKLSFFAKIHPADSRLVFISIRDFFRPKMILDPRLNVIVMI